MNFPRDHMWPSARTHLNGVKATNSKQARHQESKQHSGTPHHKMCTSFFVPLHVTTRIKEDTHECSTSISAQCGGQSAFLRAYRDLVCSSPPVEASTCGGADSADFAEYVSDGGTGVSVPTGHGRSTP